MSGGQPIAQELSLGQVVSKTFELYRRNFSKYVVPFLVVEAIIGVFTTLVRRAVVLPTQADGLMAQEIPGGLPGFLGALAVLVALILLVTLIFYPIALGSAIRLTSESIEKGQTDLAASVRFTASKLVSIWAVALVSGVIVFLGLIALVVPGLILAMMFSLALPVVVIESPGVFESLGRSRKLVGGRWLKTFALFIVVAIITAIAGSVASAISAPFGPASTFVSSLLSAFYLPLFPIAATVYYYSNVARIAPPQPPQLVQPPVPPGPAAQAVKFCPACGTQMEPTATFCSKCGAKQPA